MKSKQRPWRGHGGRDVAGTTGSKAGRRDGKMGRLDLGEDGVLRRDARSRRLQGSSWGCPWLLVSCRERCVRERKRQRKKERGRKEEVLGVESSDELVRRPDSGEVRMDWDEEALGWRV